MFVLKHQTLKGDWTERTYGEIVFVKKGIAKTNNLTTKRNLLLRGFDEVREEPKPVKKVVKPQGVTQQKKVKK